MDIDDDRARATVPIDPEIQHFAIDLDRADQRFLLPFLRDLNLIVDRIDEHDEEGIKLTKAARAAEHTDLRTTDYAAILERLVDSACLEKTPTGRIKTARASDVEPVGSPEDGVSEATSQE